ncbi:fibronectin type III domain-containing protein [Pseudomonas sp. GB2N2]
MSQLTDGPTVSLAGATGHESHQNVQICTPGNVRAWRTSATTAVCLWDEPYSTCDICPDAVGYEVSGVDGPAINVVRPPCEISGLKPDVDYFLEIYAKAAGDNRSQAAPWHLGTSPGAPRNPRVRMTTANSATLTWDTPTGGAPVSDYVILSAGTVITSTRERECVLTELPSADAPTFQIKARTNSLNFSDAVDATPPAPPINLDVVGTTVSSVTFIWAAAAPGVVDFEISIDGKVIDIVTTPRYVARDLVGEYFSFAVASRDANGNVSVRTGRSTPNPDAEPPARPPGFRLLCSTYTSVTLGWDASTDNHAVAGYRFYSPDGIRTDLRETCFTIHGLKAGVVYHCEVRAFDAARNLSEASTIDVSPADKVAPTMPTNLKVIDDTITYFRLGWEASQDNIGVRGYTVRLKTLKGEVVLTDTTTQLSYWVDYKKLTRDTPYIFEVQAFDAAGNVSAYAGMPVSTPYFATIVLLDHPVLIPGASKAFYLRLVDGFGLPVEGKEITWMPSAKLQLETSSGKTDQSGILINTLTAAADVGTYNDRLSVTATTQTPLKALATLYCETRGLRVSDTRPPYFSTITVDLLAVDEHGHPLAGADVEWNTLLSVRLSQTRTTTDQEGKSQITATQSNTRGQTRNSYPVRATVNGIEYTSAGVWFGTPDKP